MDEPTRWNTAVVLTRSGCNHSTVYRGQRQVRACHRYTHTQTRTHGGWTASISFLRLWPLCLSLDVLPFFLVFFSLWNKHTHTPHTHTSYCSFRACPPFNSSLQPVIMSGRSLTKIFSFPPPRPAFVLFYFFSPCWTRKLHDNQKILPRVHCWIRVEEGRKGTCLFSFSFL